MLRLNRNGKLARFYRFAGGGGLPDDLCTFWWGLVWRVVKVSTISIIALYIVGIVGYGLFIIARSGWRHPGMAGIVIGGLALVGLVIWQRRSLPFELVQELGEVVEAMVQATKQRFCPRIEWQGGDSDG